MSWMTGEWQGAPVAVKVMQSQAFADDDGSYQGFQQEVKVSPCLETPSSFEIPFESPLFADDDGSYQGFRQEVEFSPCYKTSHF